MARTEPKPTDGRSENVDLLWRLYQRPARASRPVLSLAAITEAAVKIADAEGLEAISMQRVATQLGVTKMALYRYVSSKAELVALMIEMAVGEPPDLSKVDGGWRAKLARWAESMRTTWQSHPWIPGATIGERMMGPREIGWTESAVAALVDTGLTGRERMDAVFLLSGHIRNCQASAGTQPWTRGRELSPLLQKLSPDQRQLFPSLLAAADDAGEQESDNGWSFGLRCILDGIELIISERAHP